MELVVKHQYKQTFFVSVKDESNDASLRMEGSSEALLLTCVNRNKLS